MSKKSTLIILILLSVFIGFVSGLATWYMTHKHIPHSFYISVIIGLIVSIIFFFWCNKESEEDDSIKDKQRKISDSELKKLYILVIVMFVSLGLWTISMISCSIGSCDNLILGYLGVGSLLTFFCILFILLMSLLKSFFSVKLVC